MIPTEEQIKELWERCGVDFYVNDNRYWARTPSGGAVELKVDLNNLFSIAVPKTSLQEIYIQPVDEGWQVDVEAGEYWAVAETPALALFWALREVLRADD